MKTVVYDLTLGNAEEKIKSAAEILKNDGIVAIPTETVYGLAASAYSNTAIKKIFDAKGRPQDNPLIVHISDLNMLNDIAVDIPDTTKVLAEKFWPGPLTMVLNKNEKICSAVSAGLNTVAVRLPYNKIAREIIRACGLPLAAPSANTSGYPSPTSAEHVLADLNGKINAVVKWNECEVGVESTVVSLAVNPPRLLRPGAVTPEQLKTVLPDLVIDNAVLSELKAGEKAASPGMKYKHYSPKTEVFLVEGSAKDYAEYVNGTKAAVAMCFAEDKGIKIPAVIYGSKNDESSLAHNIFKLLRELDNNEYKAAYVHAPSKSGIGLAVYNRLIRAAAFKVIKL